MKNDSLGDRMKGYENVTNMRLMSRTPVIIRLDGKAFHTFTRGLDKPFDHGLNMAMASTMEHLCNSLQGAIFGYTQSDEISILLQDWATFTTDGWYDYKIQKMVSVAASIATAHFNSIYSHPIKTELALFDARIFNVPFEEVENYFIWRQNDCTRNSINSVARANFSHKELQGVSVAGVHDKLMLERGINWNDFETRYKRGVCFRNPISSEGSGVLDFDCPIFTQERNYVTECMLLKNDESNNKGEVK